MDLENALGLVFPLRMILVNFCFKNYAEYIALTGTETATRCSPAFTKL